MSLNIKNEEVHAAVRALAERLGISQTSAVGVAVRDKLAELAAAERRTGRSRQLRETAAAAQEAYRGVDLRAIEADLYDASTGLPPVIVDSSALIAVLQDEPLAPAIIDALDAADRPAMSAASLVEASVVADGPRDPLRSSRFDDFVDALDLEIVPLTAAQAAIARQAYRDFGRGSGHPARLNLGDCFSYAVASERDEPLLYVGEDFAQTDLASVIANA